MEEPQRYLRLHSLPDAIYLFLKKNFISTTSRPISVTTNNDENYSRLSNLSYYKVTSENFNGQFTDERVNGVSPNHEREVQYDDDNDQPIDYSVR